MGFLHHARCLVAVSFLVSLGGAVAHGQNFQATSLDPANVQSLPKTPHGEISVIVKLDAAPLATYEGGISGLAATSPRATGRRLDRAAPQVKAYESFLAQKEQVFEQAVRAAIPRARVVHRFRKILGGVSVVVPADQVAALANMPGVQAIYPDVLLPLDTDRSPEFIGAPALWDKVGGQARAGEGVIVGIIDTGIWPEHPSVADDGSFPEPPARWTGTACQFGSATPGDVPFTCNNKLIGAARHMATFDNFGPPPLPGEFFSARDNNGHGSHTMTIAAGNGRVPATTGTLVSGVAPRAHVAAYKVCFTNSIGQGSCFTSDSAAAIEQAIDDGVDVLNFSIGGGTNPYSDAVSLAFLDAYAAGVFVAASAGNSGPGLNTVGHRGPWTTTVAATTTDKGFQGSANLTADGGASLTVTGVSATSDAASAPIVISATAPGYNDDLCLNPAPAGSLAGKIVACRRGTNARVAKGTNVLAGGATGMILYNNNATETLNADAHALPALHVNNVQGAALIAFINANTNEQASITGGANDLGGQGDVVAGFSSRGGPGQTLGVSKPDLGAPGVNILAANTPLPAAPGLLVGQLFQIISGTSMASPHVAGAGALLRQLHPTWTPGQIKSALMMTATTEKTVKEDGVTPASPFDIGSGRIDLTRAGHPGLTISDTAENYILLQANLSTSNYPSLYIPTLAGKVVVERTLKSVDSRTRHWRIEPVVPADLRIVVPREITLQAGRERDIPIFVDASAVPLGETRHAWLRFTSHHGHDDIALTFPVTVVRRQGSVAINKACDPLTVPRGSTTTCTIDISNTTFADQTVSVLDLVPNELDVEAVTGAARIGNLVFFVGTLDAAVPPQVAVEDGQSPVGYLPLANFGVAKLTGFGDETIVNFTLLGGASYLYAGATHTVFGVTSNGYVVVGGGTGADVQFLNQSLPNTAVPNNVLAPFWTDLNPATIPAASPNGIRVATLTDSGPPVRRWVVIDFQNVPNFSSAAQVNSFQVWIGLNGVQDISYTYGPALTNGDGGLLSVGAENFLGTSGENYYYNGTGTLPSSATEIVVTGQAAVPGETHTITIEAQGRRRGQWRNCAEMVSSAVFGIATSCVNGEVIRP